MNTNVNTNNRRGWFLCEQTDAIKEVRIFNSLSGTEYPVMENGRGGLMVDTPANGIFRVELTAKDGNRIGYYFKRQRGRAGTGYNFHAI